MRQLALMVVLAGGLCGSLGAGCAHRVQVRTDPVGAAVTLGKRRLGPAPVDLRVPFFGSRVVTVQLAGYRPLTVKIPWRPTTLTVAEDRATLRRTGALAAPASVVELRLVREHGGMGTWDPATVE